MMASIQTRLWNVNVGSLYYVISVVPFYGFGTGTLTSDKSSSTLAFSDSGFHISMLYVLHFYTLLLLLLPKLYTYHAGIMFIYIVCFLG